jgi:hypothetical protein
LFTFSLSLTTFVSGHYDVFLFTKSSVQLTDATHLPYGKGSKDLPGGQKEHIYHYPPGPSFDKDT